MGFTGPIRVEAIPGHRWRLLEPLTYEAAYGSITVPAGFTTDFGTVPWIAAALVPRSGDGLTGAYIIHDYLYTTKRFTRARADALMREIMSESGVSAVRRCLAWAGVRLGGWLAW